MCMKNEQEYNGCSDWLFLGLGSRLLKIKDDKEPVELIDGRYVTTDEEIFDIIEDTIGAVIVDKVKAARELEDLLDKWHEEGIMKPKPWKYVDGIGKVLLEDTQDE